MQLIYSYTTHMNNYSDNGWVSIYYRASIIRAKSFGYKIKLYGCNFIYEQLKDIIDDFVNIDNLSFPLTDDLKLFIHSNENLDCVTIDGDIILNHKLSIPLDCDVVFDTKGQVTHSKQITKYKSYLNIFKKYDIPPSIKYFDYNAEYACNVGILKFNNQQTKDIMLSSYNNFREYYLSNIEPNEDLNILSDPAIILCEYNFERIINKENLSVKFLSDFNDYTHYASNLKFGDEFKKRITYILYPNTKKII